MLTIFTPTKNRGYILSKAYEALCRQTNKDFCWLIIDDGSTDDTQQLVTAWIQEAKILIKYYQQSNGGKMRAHNKGVSLCQTELFVCVDSDDHLVDTAVEDILDLWNSLDGREQLAGIVAYRGKDSSHTMFGEKFSCTGCATMQELYEKGFYGETTVIYRTEVLVQYPFPVFDGEKFIPMAVSYDRIDEQYPLYIFPKVLTISEYRDDGISRSVDRLRENNPKGWLLYYQQRIRNSHMSVLRYKYIAHGICFCWRLKQNPFKQLPALWVEIALAFGGAAALRIIGKL